MKIIRILPYKPVINKDYDEVIIDLKDITFKKVKFVEGQIPLSFSSCTFQKLIIRNSEDIEFKDVSLMFSYCYIKELLLEDVISQNISIIFHSSLLSGIVSSKILNSLSISNCILIRSIAISGVKNIWLDYTTENIFLVKWYRLFQKLNIDDYKSLIGEKQHYLISNPKKIRVNSSKKNDDVEGRYLMHYNNNEYRYGYKLKKEEQDLLKINLDIQYDFMSDDEETIINNIDFYSLVLSGKPNGKIEIENSKICSWYMSDFLPKGEVRFHNIRPVQSLRQSSKIGIQKSNLDNVWFDNVYFDGYERLSFYRTTFSKATFTSCEFPNRYEKFLPIENVHYPEKKGDNYHKDLYEIFLQLKKSLEGTGNNYEALKLHAVSHDALRQIKGISTLDKVILNVNSWSNDHGMSIKRPIILFFIFSSVLYILYLFSLGMNFNCNTDIDWKLVGYYFSFIDITHRSNFLVDEEEFTFSSLFLDYFNKVLTGFFIYQFIAAFRKYGKK